MSDPLSCQTRAASVQATFFTPALIGVSANPPHPPHRSDGVSPHPGALSFQTRFPSLLCKLSFCRSLIRSEGSPVRIGSPPAPCLPHLLPSRCSQAERMQPGGTCEDRVNERSGPVETIQGSCQALDWGLDPRPDSSPAAGPPGSFVPVATLTATYARRRQLWMCSIGRAVCGPHRLVGIMICCRLSSSRLQIPQHVAHFLSFPLWYLSIDT